MGEHDVEDVLLKLDRDAACAAPSSGCPLQEARSRAVNIGRFLVTPNGMRVMPTSRTIAA
jgi:hypothetical protein